jgi:hypothetical protein
MHGGNEKDESRKSEGKRSDRKITLKWILNRMGGWGLDSTVLGQGPVAGGCEHGNELSGSNKRWGIFWSPERSSAFQKGFCSVELEYVQVRIVTNFSFDIWIYVPRTPSLKFRTWRYTSILQFAPHNPYPIFMKSLQETQSRRSQ